MGLRDFLGICFTIQKRCPAIFLHDANSHHSKVTATPNPLIDHHFSNETSNFLGKNSFSGRPSQMIHSMCIRIGKWYVNCWPNGMHIQMEPTSHLQPAAGSMVNEGAPPCYGISVANRKIRVELLVGLVVQDGFSCAKIGKRNNRRHCLRGVLEVLPSSQQHWSATSWVLVDIIPACFPFSTLFGANPQHTQTISHTCCLRKNENIGYT